MELFVSPGPPLGAVVSSVQTGCITYTQAHAIAVERVALGCLDETYKNIRPVPQVPIAVLHGPSRPLLVVLLQFEKLFELKILSFKFDFCF